MRADSLRLLALARCVWGATCLARPHRVAVAAGSDAGVRAIWFVRALGVREVAQGGLTAVAPGTGVVAAGIAVDGLHAASLLALAAVDASRRRPALLDALAATCWALLGLVVRRSRRA